MNELSPIVADRSVPLQEHDRALERLRNRCRELESEVDSLHARLRPLRLLDGTTYFYFEHKNLRHAEDGLAGAEMSASPAPVCALKAPVPR